MSSCPQGISGEGETQDQRPRETRVGRIHKIVRIRVNDVDDRVTLNPDSHLRGQTGNYDWVTNIIFVFFSCSDGTLALVMLI